MPQFAQSNQNPFGGSPRGGNLEYWQSVQGIAPRPIGGGIVGGVPQGTVPQGGAGPTSTQMAQSSAEAGRWASQNPVLAPQPPPLPQAMDLQQMLNMMPGYDPLGSYGASAWTLPSYAGAGGGGTAPQPPPAAAPAPPQISTGITQPQFGGPAAAPQMPQAPQWAGGGAGGDAFAQAIQPMMGQLAEQYYQQAAPLQLGAQQAQSQAGLGWAALWQMMNQQQGLRQQQQFGDFAGMLGRFA